jgi:hypothetical protein
LLLLLLLLSRGVCRVKRCNSSTGAPLPLSAALWCPCGEQQQQKQQQQQQQQQKQV